MTNIDNKTAQQEHEKKLENPFSKGLIIGIEKPYGWTSFDVVNKVRYLLTKRLKLKKLKVGHAGTLDPLATGVVVLCTGKSTKMIEGLQTHAKTYRTTIRLGATTPSYDMETEVDALYPTQHITQELVEKVLNSFVGEIQQVPPTFSACKVEGQRAYEMARKGKSVELKAKTIYINNIRLIRYTQNEIEIEVDCGKGTYIRALARDIGKALDSGGYLTSLRRTRSGNIDESNLITMEEVPSWIERTLASYIPTQQQ
ncbi:tRNA pseudouridine(55) synthase TruB [Porphyromonas sp.]|uniref:tRNA pseudouridine(55) synthase TruB n=1 Tax=Porphyromonas sp. TaxID=1924944 RepID=UPI0026DB26AF|nr:tRNA pseudouridine(55) synthase TruB [Porphyromonas sp.]MDO4695487.1 tRNA pseudouridine(55) synthase TruB [Porphyromonas sp.]MDO4770279.1 tRNA pseudouridine(55) synthase TruB [Porphyromonas sp.]